MSTLAEKTAWNLVTLSASLYMDLGDGLGIPYDSDIFSRERALRLSVDPHGANSISLVYRYRRSAWNLLSCKLSQCVVTKKIRNQLT